MKKGALLIARNNKEIDYVKQSCYAAKRINEYLKIPVSLITDNLDYLEKNNLTDYFDQIIQISNNSKNLTMRKYKDGLIYQNSLEFKNVDRAMAYDLSPYDETLLMDTDVLVSNSILKYCFEQQSDLMMYSKSFDLSGWRDKNEFDFITDTGPTFYWATIVFFRKSKESKIFFDLVKHIQENWVHYRKLYQIISPVYRNDFSFSIAAHIMNGYTKGNIVTDIPGTLYFTTDRDEIISIEDDKFVFLVEKENQSEQFLSRTKGQTVHVMNKYSLNRMIDVN